jgi:uncharacterized zinc-type alcohol dehydrogenase-like protein
VTLLSSSASKEADAKRLGAHEFVVTSAPRAFRRLAGRFDLIVDTVSAEHDLGAYLGTLKVDGAMVLVGVPPKPAPVHAFSLIGGRKTLAGSLIGGIAETQELLDFCAKKEVAADVEVIPVQAIDAAYERMLRGDVRYRFVVDLATL